MDKITIFTYPDSVKDIAMDLVVNILPYPRSFLRKTFFSSAHTLESQITAISKLTASRTAFDGVGNVTVQISVTCERNLPRKPDYRCVGPLSMQQGSTAVCQNLTRRPLSQAYFSLPASSPKRGLLHF